MKSIVGVSTALSVLSCAFVGCSGDDLDLPAFSSSGGMTGASGSGLGAGGIVFPSGGGTGAGLGGIGGASAGSSGISGTSGTSSSGGTMGGSGGSSTGGAEQTTGGADAGSREGGSRDAGSSDATDAALRPEAEPPDAPVRDTGTDPTGTPYERCQSEDDCEDGQTCHRSGEDSPSARTPGMCTTEDCLEDAGMPCAEPLTGTSSAECSRFSNVCVIDCSDDEDGCPTGMECTRPGDGVRRCQYPAVRASVFEECETTDDCSGGLECNEYLFHCAEPCEEGDSCTEPGEGDAVVHCSDETSLCILDCSDDAECPRGMTCVEQYDGDELCEYE